MLNLSQSEEQERDAEIETLCGVAMATLSTLHEIAPRCSESLADTVGRALIRLVELCRKGAPVARPGDEEYVQSVIEAVAQRMYEDLIDAGAIAPEERN